MRRLGQDIGPVSLLPAKSRQLQQEAGLLNTELF